MSSGTDMWPVKEHFTPYEYIYEDRCMYKDVYMSMYSSRRMEEHTGRDDRKDERDR